MLIKKINRKIKPFSHFIWLILLILIVSFATYFFDNNKKKQSEIFKKTLDNIYLQKTFTKITSGLESRFINIDYKAKQGDTYENIINGISISKAEKKLFLKTVTKNNNLKILKLNQNLYFKIDKRNTPRILEFKIEVSKKKEILFTRSSDEKIFISKIIEKNLDKVITYKEGKITTSLYNAAINLNIKPGVIVDFARLYGFQVDFQRDIWKNDSFQIIYEEFKNVEGKVIETGDIIYANLNLQDNDIQLYKFEYEKNKIDYFDENGKSMRKTLMKTPINGARLSSSYGKENIQYLVSLKCIQEQILLLQLVLLLWLLEMV